MQDFDGGWLVSFKCKTKVRERERERETFLLFLSFSPSYSALLQELALQLQVLLVTSKRLTVNALSICVASTLQVAFTRLNPPSKLLTCSNV